jgi:hypothetical protein
MKNNINQTTAITDINLLVRMGCNTNVVTYDGAHTSAMMSTPAMYKRTGIAHEIQDGVTMEVEREYITQGDPTTNPFVPYDRANVYEHGPRFFCDPDIDPNGELYYQELDLMREDHAYYERWSLVAWRKTSPDWSDESYEDFCQLNTYAMYTNGKLTSKADYNRRYDETSDADIFYTEKLGDWHIDGLYNWHYHRFE